MTAVVTTQGLTKRYGSHVAVDGVNLDVREGELFGLIGPNGSGKTTTLRMLLGLVYASAGRVEVLAHRVPEEARAALARVGSLVEGPAFYPHLSAKANLALFDAAGPGGARATRRARISDALERVGLGGVSRLRYRAFSTGMKQRLGIAATLLRRHELLVLDEPTNGLDPAGVREMRDLLVELVREGTTILLSSHLLSEIEMICSRAAIMHHGKVIAQSTVGELIAPTGRVLIATPDPETASDVIHRVAPESRIERTSEGLVASMNGFDPGQLNTSLVQAGVVVRGLTPERPRLEDVFLRMTEGDGNGRD